MNYIGEYLWWLVNRYVVNEFKRLLQNTVSVRELILWREVKLTSYKTEIKDENEEDPQKHYQQLLANNSSLPPGAIVSIQRMMTDERYLLNWILISREMPLYRERVPYLVIYGVPGVWIEEENNM